MLRAELDDGPLAAVDAFLIAGGGMHKHTADTTGVELKDPDLAARADRGRIEPALADRDRRQHVR